MANSLIMLWHNWPFNSAMRRVQTLTTYGQLTDGGQGADSTNKQQTRSMSVPVQKSS